MEALIRNKANADAVFNGLECEPKVIVSWASFSEPLTSISHDFEKIWWKQDTRYAGGKIQMAWSFDPWRPRFIGRESFLVIGENHSVSTVCHD